MKNGNFARLTLAAALAGGLTVPFAATADAACSTTWKRYAVSLGNSTEFEANTNCNGLWAWRADVRTDDVRGRFFKEGSWQTSTYGWKTVTTAAQSGGKIIGDTVTDRRIKGQSATYAQSVQSQY